MTESSDDSVDTVISALDSRLLHSPNSSDAWIPPHSAVTAASPDTNDSKDMGNRFGGEKRKKDEKPPEKKPDEKKPKEKNQESKSKKKGKKSKNKSKRNSHHEGDTKPGETQGACASPSKTKAKSKRPDVLADLGSHSAGTPLGSPVSATGSQGTCSFDDESDVSTLGYSTPLLSTPQVQRYVMPHHQQPNQTSTERLEELGRSIEKTILDNLSDTSHQLEGASASPVSTTEKKQKRRIKKKRDLGQAVIDSFTLPMDDAKQEQVKPSPGTLNVGSISLRASRESPVSPWLRDDDTPIDEEQMDEMFISCIDLSYNLADICSEREFTEYGSLDSKKPKPSNTKPKESSLSPSIARRAVCPSTPTQTRRMQPVLNAADSRDTPPKSDSSTSTLAELESGTETHILEKHSVQCTTTEPNVAVSVSPIAIAEEHHDSFTTTAPEQTKVSEFNDNVISTASAPIATCLEPETPAETRTPNEANKTSHIPSDGTDRTDKSVSEQPSVKDSNLECSKLITKDVASDSSVDCKSDVKNDIPEDSVLDIADRPKQANSESICRDTSQQDENKPEEEETENIAAEKKEKTDTSSYTPLETNASGQEVVNTITESEITEKSFAPIKPSESLSPQECASPKHVPPPSPSAMDALAEVDEDDEEALEATEVNSQLKEVQLFGETVLKRLSSLVESQSQDEELDERLNAFEDDDSEEGCFETAPAWTDIHQATGEITPTEQNESTHLLEDILVTKDAVYTPTHEEDMLEASKGAETTPKDERGGDVTDEGTLKKKKKKKSKKDKTSKGVVKKPDIPVELKQVENRNDSGGKANSEEKKSDSEKENTPPKRESQQIEEVINAYNLTDTVDTTIDKAPEKSGFNAEDSYEHRPRRESTGDSDSSGSKSLSSGIPSRSSLELSRGIPDIEETFSELLSVKHILDDLEDRTPTEDRIPSFISSESLRSPPDYNGRRSRMSPAVTDRTESDLDISEQRDDISTDSMYADDEDEGASEVLFNRSYSEPDGNEVVVSCTFYNTQHCSNAADSDDFWEDYSTADESFKQIEISADAATSTFQNARKQMHDIHQHLQDLRRQMEQLHDEVDTATLTSDYSVDSEDKRVITE